MVLFSTLSKNQLSLTTLKIILKKVFTVLFYSYCSYRLSCFLQHFLNVPTQQAYYYNQLYSQISVNSNFLIALRVFGSLEFHLTNSISVLNEESVFLNIRFKF
jgi:hypothetical protein